jgi:phosphoglycolate phosphatase-like HAD superfamily hydrolase
MEKGMAFIDDTLGKDSGNVELINPVGKREIVCVIHDIDGTHSLIRDWPPVMSLSIHWAMTCGLEEDFDSEENLHTLIEKVGAKELPETDEFCVESAGLSALTQMEYGIRRAVELGNVPESVGLGLTPEQERNNSQIIKRIWNGDERFDDIPEPPALKAFIAEKTPRLFQLYERILNGACRDRNTADAWKHPEKWLVPGSMTFMKHLYLIGCVNYFVTGAVIYETGGMFEEVRAVGFDVGPGKEVEGLRGSSWDRKMPKDEVIRELLPELGVDPSQALVLGDGRSEIKAGVDLGCVTISRLPADALRQRELHVELGTNYIVPDFTDPALKQMIHR